MSPLIEENCILIDASSFGMLWYAVLVEVYEKNPSSHIYVVWKGRPHWTLEGVSVICRDSWATLWEPLYYEILIRSHYRILEHVSCKSLADHPVWNCHCAKRESEGHIRKGITQLYTASQWKSSDLDPGHQLLRKVIFPTPLNKHSFIIPRVVQWRVP